MKIKGILLNTFEYEEVHYRLLCIQNFYTFNFDFEQTKKNSKMTSRIFEINLVQCAIRIGSLSKIGRGEVVD